MASRTPLLTALGRAVRARRLGRGLTLAELGARAGVSTRFLAQLEAGEGNISVQRLSDVARALATQASELMVAAESPAQARQLVALLGLRGAGKSSVGPKLAEALGVSFVELDQLVEQGAGMSLAEVFELKGTAHYRRLERAVLEQLLTDGSRAVVATGGSIVSDPHTFALLKSRATTVWLKARPEDHMNRVRAQGDERPMRNRSNAMSELRALLRARTPLYAQAHHVVDTSTGGVDSTVAELSRLLSC